MVKLRCIFLGCAWQPVELKMVHLNEIDHPAGPRAPRTRRESYIVGLKECSRCKRRQLVGVSG